MAFGSGEFTYEVVEHWWTLPPGWSFGWIPAVAVDSKDLIYVYSRSEHPMVVLDKEGNFVTSWGDEVLKDAHGIYIGIDDLAPFFRRGDRGKQSRDVIKPVAIDVAHKRHFGII